MYRISVLVRAPKNEARGRDRIERGGVFYDLYEKPFDFGLMKRETGLSKKDIYDAAKKPEEKVGELVGKVVKAKGVEQEWASLENAEKKKVIEDAYVYCLNHFESIKGVSKTYRKINATSIGLALIGITPAFVSGFSLIFQIATATTYGLVALAIQTMKDTWRDVRESEAFRVAYAVKAAVEDALNSNRK